MLPRRTREDAVREFDIAMGNPTNVPNDARYISLKLELLNEEFKELKEALQAQIVEIERGGKPSYSHTLKEAADLQYVLSGLIIALGFDKVFEPAFNRVHDSNMSKLGEDGKPKFREDGKILKGPNYRQAYLEDLV